MVLLAILLVGAFTLTLALKGPDLSAKDKAKSSKKSALPTGLALVPPDAVGFGYVRVADLWNSDLGKKLRQRFPKETTKMQEGLKKSLGLTPRDIESCTVPYYSFRPGRLFGGGVSERFGGSGTSIKEEPGKDKVKIDKGDQEKPELKKDSKPKDGAEKKHEPAPAEQTFETAASSDQGAEAEKSGFGPPTLILTTVEQYDRDTILNSVIPNSEKKTVKGKTYYVPKKVNPWSSALHFVSKRTFVISGVGRLRHMLANPVAANSRGPLRAALRSAAEKHHIAGGIQFVAKQGKKAAGARLGLVLGGDESGLVAHALYPLIRLQSAAYTVDVDKEIQATVRLGFPGEKQSKEAVAAIRDGLVLLRVFGLGAIQSRMNDLLADTEKAKAQESVMLAIVLLKKIGSALSSAKVEREKGALRIVLRAKTDPDALDDEARVALKDWKGNDRIRAALKRRKIKNDLRQLGIAMHSHNDTFKFLPAASFQGQLPKAAPNFHKGLSWRVALLPFIEQGALGALYNQFHLDEPWDSPHNIKLLDKMPKIYAPPRGVKNKVKYGTFYQAFVGNGAAFDQKQEMSIPRSFPDGTANTILLVEASKAVPWTKPEDIPYNPKKPLPKLGAAFDNGFFVLMADASTRFIKNTISKETLHAAITRAGGEVLGSDWDE
jgi:hypothetical protein